MKVVIRSNGQTSNSPLFSRFNFDFSINLFAGDIRTNLSQQVVQQVKEYFGDKVFDTHIPRSVRLSEAPSFGKPVIEYDKHCTGAAAYRNLAKEFVKRGFQVSGVGIPENNEEAESPSSGNRDPSTRPSAGKLSSG